MTDAQALLPDRSPMGDRFAGLPDDIQAELLNVSDCLIGMSAAEKSLALGGVQGAAAGFAPTPEGEGVVPFLSATAWLLVLAHQHATTGRLRLVEDRLAVAVTAARLEEAERGN